MSLFTDPAATCRAMPAMWDGETPADIRDAIAGCHACPVLTECAQWAATRDDLVGVVAGKPIDPDTRRRHRNRPRPKPDEARAKWANDPATLKPIQHGTTAGYKMHHRRGIPPCEPCKAARREWQGSRVERSA